MKKMIVVTLIALMIGCSNDQSRPQRDNTIDIVCRPISGYRCLCCNNTASGGNRCNIGQSASFFTESCEVMKDGGYMVITGDKK